MIRSRDDVYVNPYRGTAQDGIRAGRQTYRDLHITDAPRTQVYALAFSFVIGLATGVAIYVLASGQ
jgi:hypothetical protein